MGASEWFLFAPYLADIGALIATLREDTFRKGAYYNFAAYRLQQLRELDFNEYNPYETHPRYQLAEVDLQRFKSLTGPETVEDLVKIQSDCGTHSIIDLDGVSPEPGYRMATPLSEAELMAVFGTTQPDRKQVEAKIPILKALIVNWMAIFCVIYKNGLPTEVLFYGITGD